MILMGHYFFQCYLMRQKSTLKNHKKSDYFNKQSFLSNFLTLLKFSINTQFSNLLNIWVINMNNDTKSEVTNMHDAGIYATADPIRQMPKNKNKNEFLFFPQFREIYY